MTSSPDLAIPEPSLCALLLAARQGNDFGISTFGAAFPNPLNCSGFRNITEQREQAQKQ
jgi:hypothetical protein